MEIEHEKMKKELMNNLVAVGHVLQGNVAFLKDMDAINSIPLILEEPKVNDGWVGKAKCMKQILYERHLGSRAHYLERMYDSVQVKVPVLIRS